VFFVVESRGDRGFARANDFQRKEHSMTSRNELSQVFFRNIAAIAGGVMAAAGAGIVHAQPFAGPIPPAVTVSASASVTVQNDRLQAWLRAEAENANPAVAASQVNAAIAKVLAEGKAYPAVKLATAGYSTQQVSDKQKPSRWHVVQTVSIDSGDFTAAANLISKLQDEDGMLLSGMGFSLGDKNRRDAEDSVTQQAIKSWQARAQQAALGLGFTGWHPGHVTVQTGDGGRAYPMMRAQAMASSVGSSPVAMEAGTTEVSVTVSGEALLDSPKGPTR
jgi:predicted secreted protein